MLLPPSSRFATRRLLLSTFLLSGPAIGLAQQPARPRTTVVKLNVFQPLVRSYQLEVERLCLAHPRHSFAFTPQLWSGSVTELSSRDAPRPDERVNGYGLEVQHRIYLTPLNNGPLTGFYVAYAPHLQRLKLSFEADGWQELLANDGLKYYQYGPIPHTETVHRYGAALLAGYQGPLDLGPVFMDFYLGVGARNTNFSSKLLHSSYRTWMLDYAYQGLYFPAGFKIGLAF